MTGTLVATFCAAARLHYLAHNPPYEDPSQLVQGDMLVGALAGYVSDEGLDTLDLIYRRVLVFTIAAEIAAARADVRGPGTFRAALLDELYNLGPGDILERAKVEMIG